MAGVQTTPGMPPARDAHGRVIFPKPWMQTWWQIHYLHLGWWDVAYVCSVLKARGWTTREIATRLLEPWVAAAAADRLYGPQRMGRTRP